MLRKKVLVIVCMMLAATTLFGFSSPKYAASGVEGKIVQGMTDEQKEVYDKFKDNGGKILNLTKKQIKVISEAQKKNEKVSEFKKEKLKGYKQIKLNNDKTSFLVEDDGGTLYINFEAYENRKTNSDILTVTVYNPNTDEITNFVGEEKLFNGDSVKKSDMLINYNIAKENVKENADKADKADKITTFSFKWNGKTFACGMSGILLCMQYCGVWALVHPGAGFVCDLACNTAFVIACM